MKGSLRVKLVSHYWRVIGLAAVLAGGLFSEPGSQPYSPREKAYYADAQTVQFVRPGLALKITGAQIAADGTITATVSISDPQGLPLDRTGVQTPGAVSLSFVAATIPAGQSQYTAYTTRTQKSSITGVSAIQAGADSGGTFTQVGDGVYQYTFATRAPSGFDAGATHTIGVYGSRNLRDFDLGTNYASATFNFVPNGSAVTNVRDVVRSAACNRCHDQISAHGGSRRGVEMCVLCHTPQTLDPDTGNTVDLKVMIHKIHAGSSLPSVQAGKPYQIIGFSPTPVDWSTVVYPADVRRCETCHRQDLNATQATNYLTKPSRAVCGSCHDDVDFATGKNHAGGQIGPLNSDALCATCHIPQGEVDFDASIKGAHTIPAESTLLSGIAVQMTKISNGTAGSKPVVEFTVNDGSGNPLPLSKLASLSFTLAGPASDYGYTSFGADVTTPGYVSESALTAAACGTSGSCTYTFTHAIPADARGTYSIGVEARRTEVVLAGSTKQRSIQYGAKNQVMSFSVDGSPVAPRRTVVATEKCNGCHVSLSLHGTLRNQTEYCVLCHNPSQTDSARRPSATNPEDKAAPPQGVNFNLLVHRIHTGEKLAEAGRSYVVVGFGGSHNDFSDVRYPAMSPTGSPGDTRNCSMCHVGGSETNLPTGKNQVTDPQGPINPIQPISSACTGCHVDIPTASHALGNTTQLGESCTVCHGATGDFAVSKEHAQY
jgi:OmcA/MtrC family decaheme c-type cytochrome